MYRFQLLTFIVQPPVFLCLFCASNLFAHAYTFFFIVYAFIVQNSPLISQVFYIPSVLEFYFNLYIVICLHFIYGVVCDCYSLYL